MPVPTDGWGSFQLVRDVIEFAKAQGCEERTPKGTIMTPWGKKQIRYLYNPHTGGRYDISDFEDDQYMSASTIRAAERRLGVMLAIKDA